MLEKRLIAMAGACLLAFAVVVCALAAVSTNPAYAAAAVQQSSTSVVLSEGRGNIYDCGFLPLTGKVSERYALIEPGRTSHPGGTAHAVLCKHPAGLSVPDACHRGGRSACAVYV